MNISRKLSAVAVAGGIAVAGFAAAAPAQAATGYVESCDQSVSWADDMCLFYHSGYWGSNTGLWIASNSTSVPFTFTSNISNGYDYFHSSGDGQGQRLWHNMGSDENYNTYFTAIIYGANGHTTTVYADTSNNLGGNDYNIDESVTLFS